MKSYKWALAIIAEGVNLYGFKIDEATAIDEAQALIKTKNQSYDIIFLDIKLPKSKNGLLLPCEDLGIHIKDYFPSIKIIVATT